MKKGLRILILALLLCALCGCGLHNAVLDGQMEQVVACLNAGDAEGLYQRFYPDAVQKQDYDAFFQQLQQIWQTTDPQSLKLTQVNVQVQNGQMLYHGLYELKLGQVPFYMELVCLERGDTAGIAGLHLAEATNAGQTEVPAATFLLVAAYWIVVIVTVADVVRKKPHKYGWYIALALLYFRISVNGLHITLPLGAILYWAIRKKLLAQKAAQTAAALDSADTGDVPQQTEPDAE